MPYRHPAARIYEIVKAPNALVGGGKPQRLQ